MLSTIRSKLFLIFFLLGLLPLLISVFFAYHTMSEAMMAQTNEHITKLVDKTAEQIQIFFETREKEIALLSSYPFIQLSFLQFEFGQRLDTVKRRLKEYENRNRYFNNIYLARLSGETILSEPENSGNIVQSLEDRTWFPSSIAGDIKKYYISEEGGKSAPKVFITRVVYDFESPSTPVGIIVFDINIDSFIQFVSSVRIGRMGYACLWDHQGRLIFHPEQSLAFENHLRARGDDALAGLIKRMINGEKGSGDYEYMGVKKRLIFTPCNVMKWSVGISLVKSELMAEIVELRYRMLFFCAIITLLIILASYAFGKSISNPVTSLIHGVRAVGDGKWDHFIDVSSGDEIQSLADEFNKMTSRLKRSVDEIIELKNFNDDVLRSVPSGIITIDRYMMVTSINAGAARILQIPVEKPGMLHHNPASVPPVAGEVLALMRACVRNNSIIANRQIESFPANELGEYPGFIELNISPLKNMEGETVGAIAVIRDITEKKRIEEEMIRVDRLASLGELSAGMAHE